MRDQLVKWIITLGIFFGVPIAFVWGFMPYLDMSHATYLSAQGRYEQAVRALTRAIRFNPGLWSAYTRRGWNYEKLGQYDKALADFDRAISITDDEWESFNNRAWTLARMPNRDLKRALSDANQAVQLCPSCPQAYDTRGYVEYFLKDQDKAVSDYSHAINIDPRFAEAFWHRSFCYEAQKQPDKAKSDARRAQELGYIPSLEEDNGLHSLLQTGTQSAPTDGNSSPPETP